METGLAPWCTRLIAEIGALVGDLGRANMLAALLDGRALTAKELAARAGVTPQTASGHLGETTRRRPDRSAAGRAGPLSPTGFARHRSR